MGLSPAAVCLTGLCGCVLDSKYGLSNEAWDVCIHICTFIQRVQRAPVEAKHQLEPSALTGTTLRKKSTIRSHFLAV